MAIQKRFIHFKKFSDFNSKKLSANEANTQYTIGVSGAIQSGAPDILYQSYCWIKDTQQQWTHGQLYNGKEASGGEENVQSDWNVTDTSSDAYIKNKPTIPSEVTESTVSEWGFAKSSALQTKAEDSSVVHKTGNENITGAKTFNSGVNFLGSGDSNAVTLSTNTRINVNGTNKTVLGFGSGTFYINHGDYSLLLRGKDTRPKYNNVTLALSSDVDGKQDKVSGKGLSTEDFTSALKTKLEGLNNYDDTELSEALSTLRGDFDKLVSGDTTTAIKSFNEVIAFLDGIQDTQDLSSIIASIEQQIAGKMDKVTLATVATSGSYNDLSNKPTIPSEQVNADWNATSGKAQILNKPTIPSAVTESTVSGWGFTKNTGTYSKPSGGIPKTDLATAVQTSLGKADTALQSYTEQYKGTVTGVKVNGSTKSPSSGTVDIGSVVTSVKINGSSKSPSSGVVDLGTVITSHQDISGKQDKLVSGTNIKTINGQSLLGGGNITIEGGSGGGGSSSGSSAYSEVNHGASDTTFTLTPNTFHVWEEVTALTLTLGSETSGIANEFLFQFTSGSEATTLTMSDDVKWTEELAIEPNMIYQISILKGLASVLSWNNDAKSSLFPVILVIGETSQQGADVYNYLYAKYGETTAAISEELYFNRNGAEVLVSSVQYDTFEGVTGYWLNGYVSTNLKQVLTQDGSLIQRYPDMPDML